MKSKIYVLETLMSEENEVFILRNQEGRLLFSCVNEPEKLIEFLRDPDPRKFDIDHE